jgi:adenylosuccinate synthase
MINGATQLTITNLDRMFKGAVRARKWGQLSVEAKDYVDNIENELDVPVTIVSTGPDTMDIIDMRNEKL